MGMDLDTGDGKKGRAKPEMNVTPLVDVVLVLLIIFMVLMPAMTRYFWVFLPPEVQQPSDPPPNQQPPIVVNVNEAGEIRINRDPYPEATFPTRLRRMLVARGERKVYFDAADSVPYERAMEAMDLARAGGAAHIAVMTERLR